MAFVTGAGTGIGRATALAFARVGASVVATGISEQHVQETAHLIEELGGRALAIQCDVARTEDVRSALGKTIEIFGRLDFAFNNAGVEQAITAAADLTEEEWDRIVNINLRFRRSRSVAWGSPKRSPRRWSGCVRSRRPSSSDTPW